MHKDLGFNCSCQQTRFAHCISLNLVGLFRPKDTRDSSTLQLITARPTHSNF